MGVITLKLSDKDHFNCECCGGRITRLTRFVYDNGGARGVYYASFSDKHPERIVTVALSLGDWGEGSTAADRVAFTLRVRARDNQYQTNVAEPELSPWKDVEILGRMLSRDEALNHPWLKEVFHIIDHMVEEDRDVKRFLDNTDRKKSKWRRW